METPREVALRLLKDLKDLKAPSGQDLATLENRSGVRDGDLGVQSSH